KHFDPIQIERNHQGFSKLFEFGFSYQLIKIYFWSPVLKSKAFILQ
ncbi:2722_t:CDS:2, partial [Gigaspora margarita]